MEIITSFVQFCEHFKRRGLSAVSGWCYYCTLTLQTKTFRAIVITAADAPALWHVTLGTLSYYCPLRTHLSSSWWCCLDPVGGALTLPLPGSVRPGITSLLEAQFAHLGSGVIISLRTCWGPNDVSQEECAALWRAHRTRWYFHKNEPWVGLWWQSLTFLHVTFFLEVSDKRNGAET